MSDELNEFLKDFVPRAKKQSKLDPYAADIDVLMQRGASLDQVVDYLAKHHGLTITRTTVHAFVSRRRQESPPARVGQVAPVPSSKAPTAHETRKPETTAQPLADLAFQTGSEAESREESGTTGETTKEFSARVMAENEDPTVNKLRTMFAKNK